MLIGPTKPRLSGLRFCRPDKAIRRHPAIRTVPETLPDGAALIRPTTACRSVGRIRRYAAIRQSAPCLKPCLMALRLSGLQQRTDP
ncbi:hypothetical protein EH164_12970 [Kosakonia sp. CCTCC M2018092]|nr:hypothetical protein EH164_12970 [Kosakonia sp. CCTCC M2018092]